VDKAETTQRTRDRDWHYCAALGAGEAAILMNKTRAISFLISAATITSPRLVS
jgi:hypothetical protein